MRVVCYPLKHQQTSAAISKTKSTCPFVVYVLLATVGWCRSCRMSLAVSSRSFAGGIGNPCLVTSCTAEVSIVTTLSRTPVCSERCLSVYKLVNKTKNNALEMKTMEKKVMSSSTDPLPSMTLLPAPSRLLNYLGSNGSFLSMCHGENCQ